jgi:hypothetical protein
MDCSVEFCYVDGLWICSVAMYVFEREGNLHGSCQRCHRSTVVCAVRAVLRNVEEDPSRLFPSNRDMVCAISVCFSLTPSDMDLSGAFPYLHFSPRDVSSLSRLKYTIQSVILCQSLIYQTPGQQPTTHIL